MASGTPKKYVNCGEDVQHPIIDWHQRYSWCADCWQEYLEDYREANSVDATSEPI